MKLKWKHAAACALVMATAAMALTAHPAGASAAEKPDTDAYADAVVTLVNEERAAAGLNPVQAVPVLNDAAEVRSAEIVQSFSHTRPDGRSCSTILGDNNIQWRTTGENIAYGYASPESVMDGWMHSSGHRANILNENFEYIGVGVVYEGGTLYWTQVFTGGVELADSYIPGESVPSVPSQPEVKPEQPSVPETPTEAPSAPSVKPVQPSVPDADCSGTNCSIGEVCPVVICPDGNCKLTDVIGLLKGNCSPSGINGNCSNIGNLLNAANCNGLNAANCNISTLMGLLTSCNK